MTAPSQDAPPPAAPAHDAGAPPLGAWAPSSETGAPPSGAWGQPPASGAQPSASGAQPSASGAQPSGAGVPPQPPAPPRGPGVQPPFPAPPVEGRNRRVALGVGLGVGAVVVLAVVALVALVGLGTVATRAINEQMEAVVGDYIDAVRDGRYEDAYEQLCSSARSTVTESQFTERAAEQPKITGYDVGTLDLTGELTVPVDVRYADGSTAQLRAYLEQNTRTGGFEVCRVGE